MLPLLMKNYGSQNRCGLEVHFTSVDFRCPISLLYEDVVFPDNNAEDLPES